MSKIRKYTDEQIQFIKDNYPKLSRKEISDAIHMPAPTVSYYIKINNLSGSKKPVIDDSYILSHYQHMSISDMAHELNANYAAVYMHFKKLGIKPLVTNPHKVTEKDIQFIKNNYQSMSKSEMSRRLNLSRITIKNHMDKLGLKEKYKRKKDLSLTDVQFIKEHYKKMTTIEISDRLGTSPVKIRNKLKELGLDSYRFYRKKEKDARYKKEIEEYIHKNSNQDIHELIGDLVSQLGITRTMVNFFIRDLKAEHRI